MRKYIFNCLIWFILIITISLANASGEKEQRNILFVLYKTGIKKADIVGDFGINKERVVIPMLQSGKKKWEVVLSLNPDFYSYLYLLDGEDWRLDHNNKNTIKKKVQNVKKKFSFIEVYPQKYKSYIEMADKFFEQNKDEWAIKVLINAAKKFPQKTETYEKIGKFYERYNLLGFAFDAYIAGIEKNPDAHKVRYLLATCYEKAFKNTESKKYKKKANKEWLILKKVEEYKPIAREHLSKTY